MIINEFFKKYCFIWERQYNNSKNRGHKPLAFSNLCHLVCSSLSRPFNCWYQLLFFAKNFFFFHINLLAPFNYLYLHLLTTNPLFFFCALQFVGQFRLCMLSKTWTTSTLVIGYHRITFTKTSNSFWTQAKYYNLSCQKTTIWQER